MAQIETQAASGERGGFFSGFVIRSRLVGLEIESQAVPPGKLEELRRALSREERVSRALRDVGNALGATLELDELLELILARTTEVVEADRATLYLLDDAKQELVSRLVIGDRARSIRMKVGHGIAGHVAQTGKSLRVKDAYDDERFEHEWDALTGYKTTSMLATPLKNHLGRTIGVIQVLNKQGGGEFTAEDEAILSALSTQAAVAIDNSRLFLSLIQKNRQLLEIKEQLERRVQDLELLFKLERATAHSSSVEELARAALSLTAKACRARGAALLVAEEDTGNLVHYGFDAQNPDELLRTGIKSGEGFLAAVVLNGEALRVERAARDPRFSRQVEGALPFPVDSVLASPLEGEPDLLGALGLFSKQESAGFSDDDASLLRLVSANVSTALRLYRADTAREYGRRLTTIGRLLSQVIHDFKTPMTVISGYVQLMQDEEAQQVRTQYGEEILRQFDALTAMQREVLAFARGESAIFVRRVYLRKFFADFSRELGREIDGRAIELELDVDAKAVARFDESRMARALHNLARNAIEAMVERGGRLTIRGKVEGGDLVVVVEDTGPGIPKEVEGRLFQSFVTAGKKGGTGLGLAIVKKIVDEHQGRIEVDSSAAGARFVIRIPNAPLSESKESAGSRTQEKRE